RLRHAQRAFARFGLEVAWLQAITTGRPMRSSCAAAPRNGTGRLAAPARNLYPRPGYVGVDGGLGLLECGAAAGYPAHVPHRGRRLLAGRRHCLLALFASTVC